ncbi:MAG: secretin N-terminal domain-containing protein [Thermodesulfovibrionales bacterium]|nr:secretin N-terminal domain-containing protein [Thermodesulfovibrionales bacterium]
MAGAFRKSAVTAAFVFMLLASASPAKAAAQPDAGAKGPLISIELRGVDLKDVLRALSQEHGINIIVDDSISGTVTVSIRDVPLWDAIDSILRSKGYGYRLIKGNLLLIEPMSDFLKKQEDVVVREFRLKYLRTVDKSIGALNGFLSEKGQVIPVESTNSIIVRDMPRVVDKIGELIGNMDVEPAQIMIEARIVEVSTLHEKNLGIQWGAQYRRGETATDFTVNLPMAAGTPAGILGLGYIADKFKLDVQLTALESSGNAKTVSSPKIRVLENNEALITSGEEILTPVTTTAEGVTTTSWDTRQALLSLKVKPRAIANEMILMVINTKQDEFNRAQQERGMPPPKDTREASTQLIVKDGETIVIGGIYKKNESKGESGIPFLSKIPVLGWLFKRQSKNETQRELLIFITPSLIKGEKLSDLQTR